MKAGDWYEFAFHGHEEVSRFKVTGFSEDGVEVHNPDAVEGDEVEMILFWGGIKSMTPIPAPFNPQDGYLLREDHRGTQVYSVRLGGLWWPLEGAYYEDDGAERMLGRSEGTITISTVKQLIEDLTYVVH